MRSILGLAFVALGAHALGVAPSNAPAPRSAHVMASTAAPAAGSGVMTLTRFMIDVSRKDPSLQDLVSLMSSIQMGCKTIASLVQRAGINNLSGLEGGGGSINVQGEEQKKLDVVSNDVLKNALQFTGKLGVVASEEEDRPVLVEEAFNSRRAALPLFRHSAPHCEPAGARGHNPTDIAPRSVSAQIRRRVRPARRLVQH